VTDKGPAMQIGPNAVLRFVLELAGIIAQGYWGFATQDNWALKLLFGLGVPVVMAAAWGVFRVPQDGGPPVVEVAPQVRLLLEAVFFALAIGLLYAAGQPVWALVFLVVLVINYGIDYRRTIALATGNWPPN
jgi:Protein of unknown function (DUF2568)